jgi:hypothetical protein
MSNQDGETGEQLVRGTATSLSLGLGGDSLDISNLPQEQQNALTTKLAEARIDLAKKAAETQMDLGNLDQRIGRMGDGARAAQKDGTAFTATNKNTDSTGETEIVIGNTKAAHNGPKRGLFKRIFG